MEFENEITVEIDTDLDNLIKILETNGFVLKETYDLNDIYLINKNDKTDDLFDMLNKCVLIRDIIEVDRERKMLTYKYKEYNQDNEIVRQGKIESIINDIDSMKLLLEKLNFEELIRIKDHLLIYANDIDELAIQYVNNKHLYVEIEEKCNFIDKNYNSIDEMKSVISRYNIPIIGKNYFVKKAEIELQEKYGNK